MFYCLISVSSSSATSIVANGYFYNLKMAIDGCIMNKFKCLIVNCHHQ